MMIQRTIRIHHRLISQFNQLARQRIRLPGELPSPLDPKASLRFLPSRLEGGQGDYVPKLQEVAPGHYVAEHDPLEDIMARGAA